VSRGVEEARAAGVCGRVWLFGSFAWDVPRPGSDIDLLVEDCAAPFSLASSVGAECAQPVHVVTLESAPSSLRERVLRFGRPL